MTFGKGYTGYCKWRKTHIDVAPGWSISVFGNKIRVTKEQLLTLAKNLKNTEYVDYKEIV